MTTSTIEQVASSFASHLEQICPGQPYRLSEAVLPQDFVRVDQGDLLMAIVASVPPGYTEVQPLEDRDKQLVPGNTQGARHCLDALEGVRLFRPEDWNEESLKGPCLVLSQERTVLHPTHADVTFPAGTTVLCGYQREFDAEQQKEKKMCD